MKFTIIYWQMENVAGFSAYRFGYSDNKSGVDLLNQTEILNALNQVTVREAKIKTTSENCLIILLPTGTKFPIQKKEDFLRKIESILV